MQTIKAAVCHAFGEALTIEDIQLRGPEAGEVEELAHTYRQS